MSASEMPEASQEYADGYHACSRGLPASNCPYAPASPRARLWRDGYRAHMTDGPRPWARASRVARPPALMARDTAPIAPPPPESSVDRGTGDAVIVEAPPLREYRAGFKPTAQAPDPASWDKPVRRDPPHPLASAPAAEDEVDDEEIPGRRLRRQPVELLDPRYHPALKPGKVGMGAAPSLRKRSAGRPRVEQAPRAPKPPKAAPPTRQPRAWMPEAQARGLRALQQRNRWRRAHDIPEIVGYVEPDGTLVLDKPDAYVRERKPGPPRSPRSLIRDARQAMPEAQRLAESRLYQRNYQLKRANKPLLVAYTTPDGRIVETETGRDVTRLRGGGSGFRGGRRGPAVSQADLLALRRDIDAVLELASDMPFALKAFPALLGVVKAGRRLRPQVEECLREVAAGEAPEPDEQPSSLVVTSTTSA